jgi:hypothetical protein
MNIVTIFSNRRSISASQCHSKYKSNKLLKMKQILVLLGLTAAAMAAPLRQRLAQAKTSDGGAGSGILDCSCDLPGAPGAGFPAPGQGQYNNYGSGSSISQAAAVTTIPDTEWTSQCESDCCACNAGEHSSTAAAARSRHYDITGSISVAESVEYVESGNASEESVGHSQKATACMVANQNGSSAGAPGQVCVCLNGSGAGNGVSYE